MPFDASPRPRYLAIINRGAGTVRSRGAELVRDLVEEGLKAAGNADVRLVDGRDIAEVVRDALDRKSADVIVVGGGDGTIASVAGLLAGSGVALAVLPLGTMNMVSQAAGFTQSLEAAIAEIAGGEAQAVDVGRVNGRVFLHQVSFGIQPRVVRIREKIGYRSRATKMLSGALAMVNVLSRPRSVRMIGEIDGRLMRLKLSALAVSNNAYRTDKPRLPGRLDGGVLGVYMLRATRWSEYVRLVMAALRGTWKDDEMIDASEARSVRLRTKRKASGAKVLASIDGELVHLRSPIDISIEPGTLRMILPRPAVAVTAGPPVV